MVCFARLQCLQHDLTFPGMYPLVLSIRSIRDLIGCFFQRFGSCFIVLQHPVGRAGLAALNQNSSASQHRAHLLHIRQLLSVDPCIRYGEGCLALSAINAYATSAYTNVACPHKLLTRGIFVGSLAAEHLVVIRACIGYTASILEDECGVRRVTIGLAILLDKVISGGQNSGFGCFTWGSSTDPAFFGALGCGALISLRVACRKIPLAACFDLLAFLQVVNGFLFIPDTHLYSFVTVGRGLYQFYNGIACFLIVPCANTCVWILSKCLFDRWAICEFLELDRKSTR